MKYKNIKKSKYKIFSIIYSLIIMFSALQLGGIVLYSGVSAVDEWNVTTAPSTGLSVLTDGSYSTYRVNTAEALSYAIYTAGAITSDVYMTIDIVQSINVSAKYWKSRYISNSHLKKLTILGNGNLIDGLRFYSGVSDGSSSYAGLIGVMSNPLLVQELSLRVQESVTSSTGFLGSLIGATNNSNIDLDTCNVYGTMSGNNVTSAVGGLVGYVNNQNAGSITNCWSYCTINSTSSCILGGLVGHCDGGFSTVSNCAKFDGSITSTGNSTIGGLFGTATRATSYNKCFNIAALSTADGIVGGIIGDLKNGNVTINNCFNNANLSRSTGSVIGGLVGNAPSGLTFNNCYSYGNLTRKLGKIDLTEDTTFGRKEMGNYITDNGSDPQPSSWNISYNADINIQNNGGGGDSGGGGGGGGGSSEPTTPPAPTDRISAGISKKEVRTSKIITSNLCGVNATYNNSICVDRKNSAIFYYQATTLRLSLYFNYNSTSHNAGTITIKGHGSYKYNDGSYSDYGLQYESGEAAFIKVGFPYSSQYSLSSYDDNLIAKLDSYDWAVNGSDAFRSAYRGGYIAGVELTFCGDSRYITGISIALNVKYKMQFSGSSYITERDTVLGDWVKIDCEPKLGNNDGLKLNGSASDISLSTLGGEFTTISGVNGGLPVLKDFYWVYN